MSDAHTDYWREAVLDSFEQADLWHLVKDVPSDAINKVAACLSGWAENQSMAFHQPENPMIAETRRLERKLKWQRELEYCEPCSGTGRSQYMAGPWHVNSTCHRCNGAGKTHPHRESEPA